MKRVVTTRMLGCAEYKAQWIGEGLTVRLTASGFLPCANHLAQLEKRANAVWETVFYTQENREESYSPFELQAIVMAAEGDACVHVVDALGEHKIEIAPAEQSPVEEQVEKNNGQFLVYYRKKSKPFDESAYFLLPVGTKVLPIFARAYGPSNRADCEAFINLCKDSFLDELARLRETLAQD